MQTVALALFSLFPFVFHQFYIEHVSPILMAIKY